jgi:hypothetical protein
MMSKTAEFALDNLCRSMGQMERAQQLEAMRRACSDQTLRDIVNDNRTSVFLPSPPSPATVVPVGAGKTLTGDDGAAHRRSGWTEPPSIDNWKPPGLEVMDAMVDQQDAIDRAARARELSEAARTAKQLKGK